MSAGASPMPLFPDDSEVLRRAGEITEQSIEEIDRVTARLDALADRRGTNGREPERGRSMANGATHRLK